MAAEPIGNMLSAIHLQMENAVGIRIVFDRRSTQTSPHPLPVAVLRPAANLTGWQALQHHALTTFISRMETSRDKTAKENSASVSLFHPGNRLFLSGDVAVPFRQRSWPAQATLPG